MLAALSAASGTWFLLNIAGGPARSPTPQPGPLISTIWSAFQTAPFRRFISFKILLAMAAAADPFLVVYGFQELDLQVRYLGLALVAYAAGQLTGYLIWPRWIARHSPRVPFQIAALLRLMLLTWVIALPSLATSNFYTDRFDNLTVAMRAFAFGFALLGLASSVGAAANLRYVMDIAPRGATQGPILATNLVAAACAFGPFGVAWLLQRYDLERILWGAIGVAILALLASGLLIESRVRVRATTGSWRTRRQAPGVT
jgi:MFS family permease